MPRGDRTGPMGMGPMSGRGAGYCAGFGMPGFANPAGGRGFGMGFGQGRGFGGGGRGRRNMFYATGLPGWMRYGRHLPPYQRVDAETETLALKNEAKELQAELDLINKRLSAIEADAESK